MVIDVLIFLFLGYFGLMAVQYFVDLVNWWFDTDSHTFYTFATVLYVIGGFIVFIKWHSEYTKFNILEAATLIVVVGGFYFGKDMRWVRCLLYQMPGPHVIVNVATKGKYGILENVAFVSVKNNHVTVRSEGREYVIPMLSYDGYDFPYSKEQELITSPPFKRWKQKVYTCCGWKRKRSLP